MGGTAKFGWGLDGPVVVSESSGGSPLTVTISEFKVRTPLPCGGFHLMIANVVVRTYIVKASLSGSEASLAKLTRRTNHYY